MICKLAGWFKTTSSNSRARSGSPCFACRLARPTSASNALATPQRYPIFCVVWGSQIVFGIPLIYKVVMGLGVLSAVLTAGALVYTVLAWKNSYWGIAFRAFYTLVTIAAVAFVWFLNTRNLLGWRF